MYKSAAITSEKEVTLDQLVLEAGVIYNKIQNGQNYNALHADHKQFLTSYPIVLRYMYEHGMYDSDCFRTLVTSMSSKQSEEEYFSEQARYTAGLYRKIKKIYGKQLAQIRTETYNTLMKEHKKFVSDAKSANAQIEADEVARVRANADILKEFASAMPNPNIIENHSDPSVTPAEQTITKTHHHSAFAELLDH